MKEVSVLIVSFNNLVESTRPCLESIFDCSADLDYEVIVVDNASQDGTPEFLRRTALVQPRLRWIGNPTNLGYAAANNLGIASAQGQCLILLNNDTVLTPGCLRQFAVFLQQHRNVGLVGPVTNSAGNEQMIFTDAGHPARTLAQGLEWTANSEGDSFETHRLGFFCVAMRRDHVERVGVFDEVFGQGFFEDDDYCLRSIRAGFRLICLEDVFVYHHGSHAFKQQPTAAVKALMKKNRRLLEKKHGFAYRSLRACERQLQLAKHYLRTADETSRSRMSFKAANRLAMARACQPKSLAKRLWFLLRWRQVLREIERCPTVAGVEVR